MNHKYCLNVGIGDVIICKSQMMQMKANRIYVSPNHALTKSVRSGSHKEFISNFIKIVYDEPKFVITDNQDKSYVRVDWTYFNSLKIKPKYLNLRKQLCNDDKIKNDRPYIVINMKVRGVTKRRFKEFLPILKESISLLKKQYDIVLIGERKVGMNPEYIAHKKMGCEPFSLYPYVKGLGDLDLTVPELGITAPSIEDLMGKCTYFRDSSAVVNLGHGGNVTLSASVSPKTINYFGSKTVVGSMVYLEGKTNHVVLQDPKAFKKEIGSLLT